MMVVQDVQILSLSFCIRRPRAFMAATHKFAWVTNAPVAMVLLVRVVAAKNHHPACAPVPVVASGHIYVWSCNDIMY